MEKFCIDSCGAKCVIETDRELKPFFEKSKSYLTFPNLKILVSNFESVQYFLQYRDATFDNKQIYCGDKEIVVHYPAEYISDSNIAYIARYLIEKQFAENSMATCHSACVEKGGKAILLLGGAGSGKTSIALNLCFHHGFRLISNDQTLIGIKDGMLCAFGGTKFLNLRYSSVAENLPFLSYLFYGNDVEGWNDKKIVQASDLGISECYGAVEISEIYVLHLDNRNCNFFEKSGDNWGHNFNLYQNLTENIRCANSAIVDCMGHPIGYVPSYDSEELFFKRVQMINLINNNPNYKYLSGCLTDLLSYILQKRKELLSVPKSLKRLKK